MSNEMQTKKRYRKQEIGTILPEIILFESILTPKGPKYRKLTGNEAG